jgi:hypothetical protein
MSDLKIRRIPFSFDETVPFQWHPTNPKFGLYDKWYRARVSLRATKHVVRIVAGIMGGSKHTSRSKLALSLPDRAHGRPPTGNR